MISGWDKIREAEKLFVFERDDDMPHLTYSGLLVPSDLVCSYGCPAVHVKLVVLKDDSETNPFKALGVISSIDDSICQVWGPNTTEEKAIETVETLKKYFEDYSMFCPNRKEFEEDMRPFGLYPTY